MCVGIETITMYSGICEVCDQCLEQAFSFILLQQPLSKCSCRTRSPQLIPYCSMTPFALANLGVFWQSGGVLYLFSLLCIS